MQNKTQPGGPKNEKDQSKKPATSDPDAPLPKDDQANRQERDEHDPKAEPTHNAATGERTGGVRRDNAQQADRLSDPHRDAQQGDRSTQGTAGGHSNAGAGHDQTGTKSTGETTAPFGKDLPKEGDDPDPKVVEQHNQTHAPLGVVQGDRQHPAGGQDPTQVGKADDTPKEWINPQSQPELSSNPRLKTGPILDPNPPAKVDDSTKPAKPVGGTGVGVPPASEGGGD